MLIKGYEEVMKETPQQRLAKEYANRNKKTENKKPMEGKKCQKKTTTKTTQKK